MGVPELAKRALRRVLRTFLGPVGLSSISTRRKLSSRFEFVGLMLSRVCHARCIFCPITHKADLRTKTRFMSMDIVRRVADELGQNRFSGELNLGENGDALLNPDLRQAVSYIVQAAPLAKIILYTNMMHLDPELAEFLLRHNLSRLHCNIDGASKNTYEAAKPGLRFETVKENLHYFLSLRDKLASPCTVRIWILSPKVYLEAKTKEPTDLPYDVPEIKAYWLKFLSPRDEIGEFGSANILSWNLPSGKRERRQKCPPVIVQDILRKLFISTEGDVYVCCTDYNTHLTYGNVMDQSLYDLWSSERHKEIIRNILNGDYEHVGIPCVTCAE